MALALDPTTPAAGQQAVNFFGTSQTCTLTTTGGSGDIIVSMLTGTDAPNLPTATGLTFAQRSQILCNSSGNLLTHFVAPYTTNFSGTITCTVAGAGELIDVLVTGVSGADTTPGYDSGGPVTAASGNVSETTTNANDFVFTTYMTTSPDSTISAPWSALFSSSMDQHLFMYQIVAATNTYSPTITTGGPSLGGIIDAIKQASGGGGFKPYWTAPSNPPVIGTGTI